MAQCNKDSSTDNEPYTNKMEDDKNNVNFEAIFIKEEPLEEISYDHEFCEEVMPNTVKEESINHNNINSDDDTGYENIEKVKNDVNFSINNKINTVNNTLTFVNAGSSKYCCSKCNKGFALKSYLAIHMKRHTELQQYNCSLCEKTFRDKRNLTKHLKIHSGIRNYKCSVCNKLFAQSHNLKTHMKIHSGEKPFKCSLCDKSFIRKDTLQLHIKVHNGIKDYVCNICEKSFTQLGNLKQHMNVHIPVVKKKEKRFTCSNCNKKFALKGKLNQHFKMCGLVARRFLKVN